MFATINDTELPVSQRELHAVSYIGLSYAERIAKRQAIACEFLGLLAQGSVQLEIVQQGDVTTYRVLLV